MSPFPPNHRSLSLSNRRCVNAVVSTLPIFAGAVAIVSLIVGFSHYRFGSIEAAQSYAKGDRILVDHPEQFRKIDADTGEVRLEYNLGTGTLLQRQEFLKNVDGGFLSFCNGVTPASNAGFVSPGQRLGPTQKGDRK